MKTNSSQFASVVVPSKDRLSTEVDSYAGISYLPRTKIEQLEKKRKMSPRAIKKQVNCFIDEKVMTSNEAAQLFFEELSANTSKIHRHALHSINIESLKNENGRAPRGQTAGTGIRLNPKLMGAKARGGLSSQSNMNRPGFGRGLESGTTEHDRTTAATQNLLSKSGFTYYPGQHYKVSSESVLGQTLNKFELGEQDKNKLKQISGVEYYNKHIKGNEKLRLSKFVKDAAGHGPSSKRFIPLSDVAKPSLQGRVKMYMQRLNEEENKERSRQQKILTGDQLTSIQEGQQKSTSALGPNENYGRKDANKDDASFFSQRKSKQEQREPMTGGPRESTKAASVLMNNSQMSRPMRGRGDSQYDRAKRQKTLESRPSGVHRATTSMRQILGQEKKRASEMSNPIKDKMGKSQAAPRTQTAAADDEDDFNRDESLRASQVTPNKTGKRQSQNKIGLPSINQSDDKSISFGKSTNKNFTKKFQTATQPMKSVGGGITLSEQKKTQGKKVKSLDTKENLDGREKINRIYKKLEYQRIFEQTEVQLSTSSKLPLTAAVEQAYRSIFNSGVAQGEKVDGADGGKLSNLKMHKKTVIMYFRKHYANRLAQKLASMFDWSNGQLDYDVFYTRIEQLLLKPKDKEVSQKDHVKTLKKFAFQMFDMNCDGQICEADLLTFYENHNESTYLKNTLIYDIQDIRIAFEELNDNLLRKDHVMDHSDPASPKIKDLRAYLNWFEEQEAKRKEVHDSELYVQSLVPASTIPDSDGTEKGQPQFDPNDLYHQFGGGYKETFYKMIGASQNASANKVVIQKDNNETTKVNDKRDLLLNSLKEMRSQGQQTFVAEHKKKPALSYIVNKSDEIYNARQTKVYLSESEFIEIVNFKFEIPLVVLDFIDKLIGSNFIETVAEFEGPQNNIERFDTHDTDFVELKGKITEEFLPYCFQIFMTLGDKRDYERTATQDFKEGTQYLTLQSIQRNLKKVFGVRNDFFGEMLFSYISEHAPLENKINYHQFLKRLFVFFPKKEDIPVEEDNASKMWRKRQADEAKKTAMRSFVFDFVRVNGEKQITILDIMKLCCYFEKDSCKFGQECDTLMSNYKQLNTEPKYVHNRTEFGRQQYLKYVPYSCLIEDFEKALVQQVLDRLREVENQSIDEKREEDKLEEFPMGFRMESIFDEDEMGPDYQADLALREGKTYDEEMLKMKKQGKKIEKQKRHKMDKGFNIVRTWNMKLLINQK